MKNLKWCVLVLVLLVSQNGFSWVRVCGSHTLPSGYVTVICQFTEGKCDDKANLEAFASFFKGGWTCDPGTVAADAGNISLVKTGDGGAYTVVNGVQTDVASDAFMQFMQELGRETANWRISSQMIESRIDAFLETDDGYVSDARLKELSQMLGVPVTSEDSWISKDVVSTRRGRPVAIAPTSESRAPKIPADSCSLPDCSCRVVSASGALLCDGGTEGVTAEGVHFCECGEFGPGTVQGGNRGDFTAVEASKPTTPPDVS